MRTSYQVGEHYQKALEDYFRTKKEQITDISFEVIEQNSQRSIHIENENISPEIAPQDDNLNKILTKALDELYYELFQIYKHMTNKDLKLALNIEKGFIKTFLINVYQKIYRTDKIITKKDLDAFCNYLTAHQKLPFSQEKLKYYLTYCDTFHENDRDLEAKVVDTYDLFSDFFHKVKEQLDTNIVRTCEFCGTIIEPDSLYCPGCGVRKNNYSNQSQSVGNSEINTRSSQIYKNKSESGGEYIKDKEYLVKLKEIKQIEEDITSYFNRGKYRPYCIDKYLTLEILLEFLYEKVSDEIIPKHEQNKVGRWVHVIERELGFKFKTFKKVKKARGLRNTLAHKYYKPDKKEAIEATLIIDEFNNEVKNILDMLVSKNYTYKKTKKIS